MLLWPLLAEAKDSGFEARLTSAKLVELTPGKIVTASVLVANHTARDEECFEQLILPENWRKIAPQDLPFTLPAGGEEVRLVAIAVPATATAGRFEIAYNVQSLRDPSLADSINFAAVILSISKLELVVEEKPSVVVAGDDFEARLRLVNRGNSAARVALSVKSSPEESATVESPALTLESGASQTFRVHAKTDAKSQRRISQVLNIKAVAESATNGAPIQAAQTVVVEVIPRVTGDSDPYVRLPVLWRVVASAETGKDLGAQTELSGAGKLDEAGKDKIDFLFRGPDLQPNSTFGLRDEYRISLYDPLFDLHAGDRSYGLSPLTERNAYGRGAQFDLHADPKTGLGVYYVESRWQQDDFNEIGTYLRHDFSDILSVKGNFLEKNGHSFFLTNGVPARLYSIEPRLHLGKRLDLGLEYGLSDSDLGFGANSDAYRADFRGQLFDRVNYAVERVHADPKYLGYFSDSDATHGSLTFPIYEKLRGSLSANQYESNLKLNSARGSVANREFTYRPGILYTLPFKTDLSLEYQAVRREDALLPATFDFQEQSARLGLGHSFGKISLQTFVEQGRQDDFLRRENGHVQRYSVSGYYRPTPRQSYSLVTTFGSGRFASASDWQQTYGASAQWKVKESTTVNVQYARNEYNSIMNRQQDTASATVSHTFPNRHNVALSGRWIRSSTAKEREMSVLVTYSIPLSVPFARKTSIGVIKGRVFDAEKGRSFPLARVILRANELTAVTDRSGQFVFPALKPGTYVLQVDPSSIGLDRVTTELFPARVDVKKGATTTIDVGVINAGSVTVKLARMAAPSGKGLAILLENSNEASVGGRTNHTAAAALVETGGLEGGLIELSDGREVVRQVTDRLGIARFERLRPGRWAVAVYDNNLPDFHYVETPKTKIELGSTEQKAITVRILPRKRQIQFIDQGTVK